MPHTFTENDFNETPERPQSLPFSESDFESLPPAVVADVPRLTAFAEPAPDLGQFPIGETIGPAPKRSADERIMDWASRNVGPLVGVPDEFSEPPGTVSKLIHETARTPVGLATFRKEEGKTVIPTVEFTPSSMDEGKAGLALKTFPAWMVSLLPQGKVKDISAGAYNAVANLVNFFLSPQGAAVAGTAGLPAPVQRTISGKFAWDMALAAPEQLEAGSKAFEQGDYLGATENWLGGAGAGIFAGVASKHAITPKAPKSARAAISRPPTELPPEAAPLEPQGAQPIPIKRQVTAGDLLNAATQKWMELDDASNGPFTMDATGNPVRDSSKSRILSTQEKRLYDFLNENRTKPEKLAEQFGFEIVESPKPAATSQPTTSRWVSHGTTDLLDNGIQVDIGKEYNRQWSDETEGLLKQADQSKAELVAAQAAHKANPNAQTRAALDAAIKSHNTKYGVAFRAAAEETDAGEKAKDLRKQLRRAAVEDEPAIEQELKKYWDTAEEVADRKLAKRQPVTFQPETENASTIPSATSVLEPEVRPSVGEATPLRQPGQAAEAQAEVPRPPSSEPTAEAKAFQNPNLLDDLALLTDVMTELRGQIGKPEQQTLLEVQKSPRPLTVLRDQMRRALDEIERRQDAFEGRKVDMPLEDAKARLEKRLGEIEREMAGTRTAPPKEITTQLSRELEEGKAAALLGIPESANPYAKNPEAIPRGYEASRNWASGYASVPAEKRGTAGTEKTPAPPQTASVGTEVTPSTLEKHFDEINAAFNKTGGTKDIAAQVEQLASGIKNPEAVRLYRTIANAGLSDPIYNEWVDLRQRILNQRQEEAALKTQKKSIVKPEGLYDFNGELIKPGDEVEWSGMYGSWKGKYKGGRNKSDWINRETSALADIETSDGLSENIDVKRMQVQKVKPPTPQDIADETGLTYDAGMESMLPADQWHFTDNRPDSPTREFSVVVPKGSTAEQVQKALEGKLPKPTEAPKRVRIAGAEFDVVRQNPDGTLTLKSDGGEFDTMPGEKWTAVGGDVSQAGPSQLDTSKVSRAEYQKSEVDRIRALRKIALAEAEAKIRSQWTPKKPLPVGISKVSALEAQSRHSPTERQLLATLRNARRNAQADLTADFEHAGRVWDEIKRRSESKPSPPTAQPGGEKGTPKEVWENSPTDNLKRYAEAGYTHGISNIQLQSRAEALRRLGSAPSVPDISNHAWQQTFLDTVDNSPELLTRKEFVEGQFSPATYKRDNSVDLAKDHKELVADALREGKPVPPEVLLDYPDLQSNAPQAPSSPGAAPTNKSVGERPAGETKVVIEPFKLPAGLGGGFAIRWAEQHGGRRLTVASGFKTRDEAIAWIKDNNFRRGAEKLVIAEQPTPTTPVAGEKAGFRITQDFDQESGETNYKIIIPKELFEKGYGRLGDFAAGVTPKTPEGDYIVATGYSRTPQQALERMLYKLAYERGKTSYRTMAEMEASRATHELAAAPIREAISELFRPLIKKPLETALADMQASGTPAIWIDDQVITPRGKYEVRERGKLKLVQELSQRGFEKNIDDVAGWRNLESLEGKQWGANKAAKELMAKRAAERAAKEKADAEKKAEEQRIAAAVAAERAAYDAEWEAVQLPRGKKQNVQIPVQDPRTGEKKGFQSEEMTVYGSLGIRKNTSGSEKSGYKYFVTHVPTGLSLGNDLKISTLKQATDFVKALIHTGVDLSKKTFTNDELKTLSSTKDAMWGDNTGVAPDWWKQKRTPPDSEGGQPAPKPTEPTEPPPSFTNIPRPENAMSAGEARSAISGEDTAGFPVEVVTRDQAVAATGTPQTATWGGFFWKGKVWLIHENLDRARPEAVRELLREEVGHGLLRTVEGTKLLQQVMEQGRIALTAAERQKLLDEGYRGSEMRLLDEFIAKSMREQLPWWVKAVEQIKAWLAKLGLVNLTNEEAARVLLREIRRGTRPMGELASTAAPGRPTGNSDYDAASDFLDRHDREVENLVIQVRDAKPGARVQWSKVPAARLKKIWLDFGKSGVVRDEKGMQNIADSLLSGIARLKAATELMSHERVSPEEVAESAGFEWTPKMEARSTTFFTDERGNWTLSDYGMEPLERLYGELFKAETAEQQLYAADKILNVVHQRSDLAALFVEGGSKTLSEIADQGGYVSPETPAPGPPTGERESERHQVMGGGC